MDIAITRMSSKGQIVIPSEMREDFPEKTEMVIIKRKDTLILKKAKKITEKMKDDIEFARRTSEAWKRYEKNPKSFKRMDFDAFLEEIKKW